MVWCTTPKLATIIMLGFGNYQIEDRIPIYKQIVDQIETSVMSGKLKPGDQLPSMKEFALMYDISKETVKKAYGILVRRGLLESSQGKGFFVRSKSAQMRKKVLLMVDNLSTFKQVFVNSFLEALGNKAEAHILVHNNDVDLFRYYLDQSLGKYDIYVIMPHFPRDEKAIKEIEKQMLRIPSRQLILADMLIESLPGDFGAVYQDFYDGMTGSLKELLPDLRKYSRLDMFTLPNCLYGDVAELAVARFCDQNGYHTSFHHELSPKYFRKNQVCLFYNHIDQVMLQLNEIAEKKGLVMGEDIKIICYNESPICTLLCGGITTISVDFRKMAQQCAEMVKSGKLVKVKAEFKVTRRKTF